MDHKPNNRVHSVFSLEASGFEIGLEVVISIIIGGLLGHGIDYLFNTGSYGLFCGLVLGMVAGCLKLYHVAKEILKSSKDNNNQDAS